MYKLSNFQVLYLFPKSAERLNCSQTQINRNSLLWLSWKFSTFFKLAVCAYCRFSIDPIRWISDVNRVWVCLIPSRLAPLMDLFFTLSDFGNVNILRKEDRVISGLQTLDLFLHWRFYVAKLFTYGASHFVDKDEEMFCI